MRRLVYVDSGSTDGSVQAAYTLGAEVVTLDMTRPFTAARARNAGLASLAADPPDFVQLLDGDCQMQPGWLPLAQAAFDVHAAAVVVCGRRQERFPEASVWNRLADREWNTPVGPARSCGGDALMRFAEVQAAGGYRDDLIAGEEPELCLRLIRRGGEVWRIDADMTLHDAALTRMSQWWRRSRRAGHAFAEGSALHGAGPERHWRAETRRALLWGFALPLAIVVAGLFHTAGFLLVLIYPLQVLRLSWREGLAWAFWTTLAKFAEAQGVLGYWLDRLLGRRRGLIEYK